MMVSSGVSRRDLPDLPLGNRRGGGTGAAFGPGAQGADLLGHELGQRHEVHQHCADGEIGGLGILIKSAVEGLDEDLFKFPSR